MPRSAPITTQKSHGASTGTKSLPNLFMHSMALLVVLYGVLTLLLITAVEFRFISVFSAVISGVFISIAQFVVSPWILDISLRYLHGITWIEEAEVPIHVREIVYRICATQNIKFPSFGIIDDGAPQAFTYGHYPNNARLVLSRGIFEILNKEEAASVVAHEMGHICRWDMVIMTIAQLVPLLAFYIYQLASRISNNGEKRRGFNAIIALGSYVTYALSQLVVLWFSRVREYYADQFSSEQTGNPNALASALIKIGYGLARYGEQPRKTQTNSLNLENRMAGFSPLNIFDKNSALNLALSAPPPSNENSFDSESIQNVLQWDLWNPWALFFEVQSTHPLIAKRIARLGDYANALQQSPFIVFDRQKPESYWDDFVFDILIHLLPLLAAIFSVGGAIAFASAFSFHPYLIGLVLITIGASIIFKTNLVYRSGNFSATRIESLLHEIKVSPARPVPATLQGTIIGRGIPGLIWSEDFVMKDASGLMLLDYRQPLRVWEFFFGIARAGAFQGKEVSVQGWFRRNPVPYFEVYAISSSNNGKVVRCYVRDLKLALGLILLAIGALFLI